MLMIRLLITWYCRTGRNSVRGVVVSLHTKRKRHVLFLRVWSHYYDCQLPLNVAFPYRSSARASNVDVACYSIGRVSVDVVVAKSAIRCLSVFPKICSMLEVTFDVNKEAASRALGVSRAQAVGAAGALSTEGRSPTAPSALAAKPRLSLPHSGCLQNIRMQLLTCLWNGCAFLLREHLINA